MEKCKPLISVLIAACPFMAMPQTSLNIYEIQHASSYPFASPWADSVVVTSGIVTAVYPNGYFIQDGDSVWCGIYVFDNAHTTNRGDSVTITAQVSEYFRMTELKSVSAFTLNSSGNPLPAAATIPTDTSGYEPYEGMLVKVSNAVCNDPNSGFGQWIVNDGSGNVFVDDLIYAYTPVLNAVYDVRGVVYYSFSEWKIEPRDSADITETLGIPAGGIKAFLNIYPLPAHEWLHISFDHPLRAAVYISSISGQRLYLDNHGAQRKEVTIDLSRFAAGIYMLTLKCDGKVIHKKIPVR